MLLSDLRTKGVQLWIQNDKLHYKAPRGSLSDADIQALRDYRVEIKTLVANADSARRSGPRIVPRPRQDLAPLTYSQLAHWNMFNLGKRRVMRGVISATRMRGSLDTGTLCVCHDYITERHSSLRTQVVLAQNAPIQKICTSIKSRPSIIDLSSIPKHRLDYYILREISDFLSEPIDVAQDALFAMRVLRASRDDHILILALEHIIADGFSLNILFRDFLTFYQEAPASPSAPNVQIQLADYAAWQRGTENTWIETNGNYWRERLRRYSRPPFPAAKDGRGIPCKTRWARVPIYIGIDLTNQLREWCQLRKTTLVMIMLTAYAALILRWCNCLEVVVKVHSDCRFSREVENIVGYLASHVYLHIEINTFDTLSDLFDKVVEAYCQGHEYLDYSYLTSEPPRLDFTKSTFFNWIPRAGNIDLTSSQGEVIRCAPFPVDHPNLQDIDLDDDPGVVLTESSDGISGWIVFPWHRFSTADMETFGELLSAAVRNLLSDDLSHVRDLTSTT